MSTGQSVLQCIDRHTYIQVHLRLTSFNYIECGFKLMSIIKWLLCWFVTLGT